MAASCWQGREMCITCILQQAHFGEEKTTMDSFQCLMKQMTWTLLYETLNIQNISASDCPSTYHNEGFCSYYIKKTSKILHITETDILRPYLQLGSPNSQWTIIKKKISKCCYVRVLKSHRYSF